MDSEHRFKAVWHAIERPETQPKFARKIITLDYGKFANDVMAQHPTFVEAVVQSLYAGDIYILKNGFPKSFVYDLLENVHKYWNKTPSSFHKMVEGCPDFHRIQDEQIAAKYVFKSVRHSCYFFHWNGDPLGIIPPIMERWRVFKFLGGFRADAYEHNTPKDGVIDRIQVAQYPPKIGISETHSDPWQNQRTFISAFMSKRGVDYEAGGFYVVGPGNVLIDVEPDIDVGDVAIGYATVLHGVDRIDPQKECDWSKKDGRWWLGLYSNSSDMVKERATGVRQAVELKQG